MVTHPISSLPGGFTLPPEDASHSDLCDFAAKLSTGHRMRLAAALVMQELDPDGAYSQEGAITFAQELSSDYEEAFLCFVAFVMEAM